MIETPYIKIYEHGIDLLKNYSVIKHFDYLDVDSILIKKDFLHKNWIPLLVFGLVFSIGGVTWGINIYSNLVIDVERQSLKMWTIVTILTPWILAIWGLFWILQSLKQSLTLTLHTSTGKTKVAVPELRENQNLDNLVQFLKERVEIKVR